MRIVENNAPVKREKCWNCNSILELNLTDYDTSEEHFENVSTFDGSFHFVLKTYFVCPCCNKKNYCAVTIDGEKSDLKYFNR